MSRKNTAERALTRSYRGERVFTFGIGLLIVIAAAAVLLVGYRVFGEFRAQRPLLDPIAINWLREHQNIARIAVIVVGLLLAFFGLRWFFHSLRPERHPNWPLTRDTGRDITVTAGAIAQAVRLDVESIPGVTKAQVRGVGDARNPVLRISMLLREDSDIKQVWHELDTHVLARARESLELPNIPAAIRLDIEPGSQQRVQ